MRNRRKLIGGLNAETAFEFTGSSSTTNDRDGEGSYFDLLPDEILLFILTSLDVKDLVSIAGTCRRFRQISAGTEIKGLYLNGDRIAKAVLELLSDYFKNHATDLALKRVKELTGEESKIKTTVPLSVLVDTVEKLRRPTFLCSALSDDAFFIALYLDAQLSSTLRTGYTESKDLFFYLFKFFVTFILGTTFITAIPDLDLEILKFFRVVLCLLSLIAPVGVLAQGVERILRENSLENRTLTAKTRFTE